MSDEIKKYEDFVLESFLLTHKPTLANPQEPFAPINKQVVALGLGGECGEALDVLKKSWRDGDGQLTAAQTVELKLELGDVLWNLSAIAQQYGLSLQEIIAANQNKILMRELIEILNQSEYPDSFPSSEHEIFDHVRGICNHQGIDFENLYMESLQIFMRQQNAN